VATSDLSPVLIVGAGPAGLTAALAMRGFGFLPTVIDADTVDRLRPGCRGLFIHRDSLKLWDGMRRGLAAGISQLGLVWRTRRTLYRGRVIKTRTYLPGPPGTLPPFISLRQAEIERHLVKECMAAGVDFVWASQVSLVKSFRGHVVVTANDGRSWRTKYLIAADGARSSVRRSLGITMAGNRSTGLHAIVDISECPRNPMPVEIVFHYEHPALGGRNVLLVPFAGGWQVDIQCHSGDTVEDAQQSTVRRWLPRIAGDRYIDRIISTSTYDFQQRIATSFVDEYRRVLLIGDAAHQFAPFGARGMNSAIADASSAATMVAAALACTTQPHHPIEEFARTRRAAAERNGAAAAAALDHLAPRGRFGYGKRRLAAALAPAVPWCANWLDIAPYGPRDPRSAAANGRY
jgi:3-(3-hydroxy-phenyl)propionate hydroxylase